MGNVVGFLLKCSLYIYSFTFDLLTLPFFYCIQQPWKVLEKSKRVKAKQVSSDSDQVTYESLTPMGSIHKLLLSEKIDTLEKVFSFVARTHTNKNCLGTRQILKEIDEVQADGKTLKKFVMGEYKWKSFIEAESDAINFGKGIRELGVEPRARVAIFAETRAEWMLAAQGLFKQACGIATIYATLGEDGIIYAINQTEVTTIVTSHDLIPKLRNVLDKIPSIKNVIYFEDQLHETNLDGMDSVKIYSFKDVIARGKESVFENTPPTKDDLAILMYTSGSTGNPKGVLLTHNNLLSTMKGYLDGITPLPTDVFIGYLPLAHSFELLVESTCMLAGVPIGYSTPFTLIDSSPKIPRGSLGDAKILKPTFMTIVPLVLDRIVKGLNEKVREGGKVKETIFNFAYDYKKKWHRRGYKTSMTDALVFKTVGELLGGRIRGMISGGAPLSPETHEKVRLCLCIIMAQGYGLTETSAGATCMDEDDITVGRSGSNLSSAKIKLVNWEEGNYFVTNKPYPQGEVIIGGELIADGYFKMSQETSEAFYEEDEIKWFKSGDIGEFHEDGSLKIIDRKKDLVKLQHGEYISLGKVEAELKTCQIVENICVYCDSTKSYCIALVQPAEIGLTNFAKSIGVNGTYSDLCKNPQIIKAATEFISDFGKKRKLGKFEIPTKISLCEDPWTPESNLVTAAFKIKRKEILTKYENEIKKIYV